MANTSWRRVTTGLTAIVFSFALSLHQGGMAAGKGTDHDACLTATEQAARATGAPLAVLRALALTESGHNWDGRYAPWPWTVNMQGKGLWFDTPDQALAYIRHHASRGARSFDVGCFQINHKWHGRAFGSISDMLDPQANALYAARFLTRLYHETGDWSRAAGAYHSRTPDKARRYRARFDRLLAQLSTRRTAPAAPKLAAPEPRTNRYPLLRVSNAKRGIGSLVPRTTRMRLFDNGSRQP